MDLRGTGYENCTELAKKLHCYTNVTSQYQAQSVEFTVTWITTSMQHSPSWEANSHAAS